MKQHLQNFITNLLGQKLLERQCSQSSQKLQTTTVNVRSSRLKYNYRMAQPRVGASYSGLYEEGEVEHINVPPKNPPQYASYSQRLM